MFFSSFSHFLHLEFFISFTFPLFIYYSCFLFFPQFPIFLLFVSIIHNSSVHFLHILTIMFQIYTFSRCLIPSCFFYVAFSGQKMISQYENWIRQIKWHVDYWFWNRKIHTSVCLCLCGCISLFFFKSLFLSHHPPFSEPFAGEEDESGRWDSIYASHSLFHHCFPSLHPQPDHILWNDALTNISIWITHHTHNRTNSKPTRSVNNLFSLCQFR